mmetsp:Transcript_28939/g.82927  ORF Transcript_28939/g.82927 Transcript_28939/m.82927 type:complete len:309 (-) Transcript_28939:136-1062(-)
MRRPQAPGSSPADAEAPRRAETAGAGSLPEHGRDGCREGLDHVQRVPEVQAVGTWLQLGILADHVLRPLGVLGNKLEVLRRGKDLPPLEVQDETSHVLVPIRDLRHQVQRLLPSVLSQVPLAQQGAPDPVAAVRVQAGDGGGHGVEGAAAHVHAAVAEEGDLLLAVAAAALRREPAVLAPLRDEQPILLVPGPGHAEGRLGGAAARLVPITGVVEEELNLPVLQGHLGVHQELLGVCKQPVLQRIRRPLNSEAPQSCRASQRLHEVSCGLACETLLNDVSDLKAAFAVPPVAVGLVVAVAAALGQRGE